MNTKYFKVCFINYIQYLFVAYSIVIVKMENTYEELDSPKINEENIYEELDNKNDKEHKEHYENDSVSENEYENKIDENEVKDYLFIECFNNTGIF